MIDHMLIKSHVGVGKTICCHVDLFLRLSE